MKKGFFLLCFAAVSYFSFGQSLHKGNLLGLHTFTPNLKEGITREAYATFFTAKAIPAYEKAFSGIKMYLLISVRGQDSSSMGVIYMFKNEGDRNKYFNNDGTLTTLGQAANAKLAGIVKEFENYETANNAARYNDWLVL